MQSPSEINREKAPRLRRTVKAMRSGFRRYPRAIYESLMVPHSDDRPLDLPEVLHRLSPHDLAVMWLGHGSLVAQIHDVTVTLDPVLSHRIGMRLLKLTIGLSRITPAPLPAESLIGSDLVLISHAHFDHLDKPTLEKMASPRTTVIVPPRCRKLIPKGFERVIELMPGERVEIKRLSITAIEPNHWGARSVFDRRRGVNSYLVESGNQRVLFTGDTAETSVYENLAHIDLAVFGIGAYDPWDHMHATPEQAWSMFEKLDAKYLLPVHHSTFELSDEPLGEPMRRLRTIAGKRGAEAILEPHVGEVIVLYDANETP
ncbi:MAG: MBL fold metallo-hydrolase [Phycisphaerales bacterium]